MVVLERGARLLSIVYFLLFSFSLTTHADYTIRSDVQFRVDPSILESSIGQVWRNIEGRETISIPAQNITEPFTVSIGGINAIVDYSIQKPENLGDGVWQFESSDIGASIHVGVINATQVIEKIQNGMIIRIELNAVCRPFVITLPRGGASVAAKIRAQVVNGRIELTREQLAVNWSDANWKIPEIQCDAPEGFDTIVKQQVRAQLGNSRAQVMANLEAEVRRQLDVIAQEAREFLAIPQEFKNGDDSFTAKLEPENSYINEEDVLVVDGTLVINFPTVEGEDVVTEISFTNEELHHPRGTSILLPVDTIRAMFMGAHLANSLRKGFWENEFKAFYDFRRDMQLTNIVWPDLDEFSYQQQFYFQTYLLNPMEFGRAKMDWDGYVRFPVNMDLVIQTYAPSRYQISRDFWRRYLAFNNEVSATAAFSVVDGVMKIGFERVRLNIEHVWNKQYLERFPWTNTWVNSQLLEDPIADLIEQETYEVELPKWEISEQMTFQPAKMVLEGQTLRLNFEIKSQER